MKISCEVCQQAIDVVDWRVAEHQHKFGFNSICYGSHMPILELTKKSEKHPPRMEVGSVVFIMQIDDDDDDGDGDEEEVGPNVLDGWPSVL